MSKTKKTAKHLYDCNGSEFMDMGYIEALEFKILKAKELLSLLAEESYITRDNARINDVLAAIKFNKRLIEETEE